MDVTAANRAFALMRLDGNASDVLFIFNELNNLLNNIILFLCEVSQACTLRRMKNSDGNTDGHWILIGTTRAEEVPAILMK